MAASRFPSPIMQDQRTQPVEAGGLRIAIIVSQYHDGITMPLRDGARQAFVEAGGSLEDLTIVEAAGAWELVALTDSLLGHRGDELDAVVALGCVITGETTHDQYINSAVSTGLMNLQYVYGLPISFGVLTCQTVDQAASRAGGDKGNKGAEAMAAAIQTVCTTRTWRDQSKAVEGI